MERFRRLLSFRYFSDQPHFVPGDTRDSFLARIRIRKLLQYSQLAALILIVAGPIAIVFYEPPNGTKLGLWLLLSGVLGVLLLPFVARWNLLRQRSEWVSPLMTVFFLIPSVAPVVFRPDHDRGRTFVFVGIAMSSYCLSRRSFLLNYLLVAIAWFGSWHFCGLDFGADDAIVCFLAVPIVGYLICVLQTDSLVSLFDLHHLALDQQKTLQQTLEQLTLEIHRRQEEERLRIASHEQLQEQQEQLLHVSRLSALGEMAAGIAHEIRQPLHALSMYAGILESVVAAPPLDHERLKASAGKVSEIVRHTSDVIQGLQNFASRREKNLNPVSMQDVIRDAVLLTEPEWRRRGVQITVDRKEPVHRVLGDSVQLCQVIVNLLRNSCEAMGTNPIDDRRLTVHLRTTDGYVEITVADNGCGFTPDQKAHLFETFYTTKDNGLGMGMSISRRIIEEHRGTLTLLSTEEPGATFLIQLPALDLPLNNEGTDTIHGGSSSLPD